MGLPPATSSAASAEKVAAGRRRRGGQAAGHNHQHKQCFGQAFCTVHSSEAAPASSEFG